MESLYLLIPLSVILAILFGALLWWSSQSGQFDDLEGPAYRILQDDDSVTAAAGQNHNLPPQEADTKEENSI